MQTTFDMSAEVGFHELDAMLLCGREGSLHERLQWRHGLTRDKYLSLTWYKMESGRYEVVAYVS